MSKTAREHKIVSLIPEAKPQTSSHSTHNLLLLETVVDEETGVSYPIYVQPYDNWNEYGILDALQIGKSLLEIASFFDEDEVTPAIDAWWTSPIAFEEYLHAVNMLYDHIDGAGQITQGHLLVGGPVRKWRGMNLVHTSFFDLKRPLNMEEAQVLQQQYYQALSPTIQAEIGWPFTFDQATLFSLYAPQVGNVTFDQQSGVIGIATGSSVYKGDREIFLNGMEQYCVNTQAVFPSRLIRKVFDHVLHDPYQM